MTKGKKLSVEETERYSGFGEFTKTAFRSSEADGDGIGCFAVFFVGCKLEYARLSADHPRDEAITRAHASGGYSLLQIGDHFGLHYSRISQIVRIARDSKLKAWPLISPSMCYSAEVEEDWKKFLRVTGADMTLKDIHHWQCECNP